MAIEKYVDETGQVKFRRVDEKENVKKDQTFVNNLNSVDPPEVDNAVGYAFKLGLIIGLTGLARIDFTGADFDSNYWLVQLQN